MREKETLEDIGRTSTTLMLREPFYAYVLLSLNKGVSDAGETAWVRPDGTMIALEVNPSFWWELTEEQKYGTLKHELLHVCFGHLTETFDRIDKEDSDLANIAMDIAVNQHINKKQLIRGACTLEWFNKSLGMKMKKLEGCIYYFDELRKKKKEVVAALEGGSDEMSSGAFNENETPGIPKHERDSEEEIDTEILKGAVERMVEEAAGSVDRGLLPGEIESVLDKIRQRAKEKIDWRGVMRRFVGSAESEEVRTSWRRVNYRWEDNPGLVHKKKVRVLACVDVSGSVDDVLLKNFIEQLEVLEKRSAEVDLLQFDARVHCVDKLRDSREVRIYGRGGTSFQAPIDYYKEHRRDYDCCVIVTDGYAPAPEITFGTAKLLWIIWNRMGGVSLGELKGTKIVLNKEDID